MESSLMRVIDAVQLLKVSKWTIYRWIEEGRLRVTKIGWAVCECFEHRWTGLSRRVGPIIEMLRKVHGGKWLTCGLRARKK
jgi:excisionase family DNA binding protein